jgi:DNA-directed RNA polymerase subunit RPC12/RpoP
MGFFSSLAVVGRRLALRTIMLRTITCPVCGHKFDQQVDDMTLADAARLRTADEDANDQFPCPNCKKDIQVKLSDLPDFPPAP